MINIHNKQNCYVLIVFRTKNYAKIKFYCYYVKYLEFSIFLRTKYYYTLPEIEILYNSVVLCRVLYFLYVFFENVLF